MSVLIFSDNVLSNGTYGTAVQCLTGSTPQYSGASAPAPLNTPGATTSITFWQGTIPSNSEVNVFTNSTRTADALLRFTSSGAFTSSGKRITANFGTASFGTIIAAGTITWFSFGNTDTITNRPMVFGTVGLTGSGADLILPKTNVVLNDLWLCSNLYFDVNNTATFA
jgi:hypothetical protein